MSVSVQVVTTKKQKSTFLNLPWELYRGDPNWVPPLRMNQKEMVNYKRHPFFDDAEITTFLAYQGNKPVGRIAAIVNHGHNRLYPDEQRGFVGFFESIDDQAVANALFDAAREQLASQGLTIMRGPTNPSQNHECGLLVQNFDMPPTFMLTYNHEYYVKLWENYGWQKAQDLLTFVGFKSHLSQMEKKIQFVADEAAKRFNVKIRRVNKRRFLDDVRTFLNIYNQSLYGQWGHVPMSDAEVVHTANSLRFLIVPEVSLIAEVDGKPVGSMIGLLDYNPRIKQIDGRLFPFGFLKLLLNRGSIKRLRLLSTNVLPEYQRWGIGVILASRMLQPALDFGMEEGEFSWVLESNHLSRKTLERGKLLVEKVHRMYDWFPND
ncbi:MAG: GNAT family N-acetyltransferase [Planctomycetota bacterium]